MTRVEILKKLNEIFSDVLDIDDLLISEDTTAADVEGWDSLTHITLIAEVEDQFDMEFAMKEVIGMKNIGEMIDILQREIS